MVARPGASFGSLVKRSQMAKPFAMAVVFSVLALPAFGADFPDFKGAPDYASPPRVVLMVRFLRTRTTFSTLRVGVNCKFDLFTPPEIVVTKYLTRDTFVLISATSESRSRDLLPVLREARCRRGPTRSDAEKAQHFDDRNLRDHLIGAAFSLQCIASGHAAGNGRDTRKPR
jgi:hypothetical protein